MGDEFHSEIRRVSERRAELPLDAGALDEPEDLYAAGMRWHASVDVTLALEDTFEIEFPSGASARGSETLPRVAEERRLLGGGFALLLRGLVERVIGRGRPGRRLPGGAVMRLDGGVGGRPAHDTTDK